MIDFPAGSGAAHGLSRNAFARKLRGRIFGLMLVLGGGLFLLLVAALGWFAFDQDNRAAAMSRYVARSAVNAKIEFMNKALTQYAVWDDPIEHVLLHLDHRWADDTIGPYVFDQLHIEQSYVIGADGRLLYAMRGRKSGPDQLRIDPALAKIAIAAARRPDAPSLGQLLKVDGRPAVVGIQKITPSTDRFKGDHPAAAMVFVDLLDAPMLSQMGKTYAISGLRPGTGAEKGAASAILLRGRNGSAVGWIAWDQLRPGLTTLRQLAPVVALLAVALALGAASLARTVSAMVGQMLLDRCAAEDALVRARVALQAAQAAQGDAERLRLEMRELESAQAELAGLRQTMAHGRRYAA